MTWGDALSRHRAAAPAQPLRDWGHALLEVRDAMMR